MEEEIYKKIATMLKNSAKKYNLVVKTSIPNSQAKVVKTQIHLYGKKEVQIFKKPKQQTYIAGAMIHKNYVGFYSMAVYAFPEEFELSEILKKTMKGKSCFHIKSLDKVIQKEVLNIVEKNIKIFKKEGWI